jgi:shikimate kinase
VTPRVVLVGLPGSGKTSTGRRLAKILSVPFVDSDELVEAQEGRTVRVIFAESGEDAFRRAEADAVRSALRDFDGVLSLGGGAPTTPAVRESLTASSVPVALLRAQHATLLVRVGDAKGRPLLADDPEQALRRLADERARVYAQLATFAVDTDHRTPGQVAATLAARLHALAARPQ